LLHKPNGTVEILKVQQIATGLDKITYEIHEKESMTGTYTLVVEASRTTSTGDATGTSIKTFLVKEPYKTWEKKTPKAALVLGTIFAIIIAWRKQKQSEHMRG